MCKQDEKKGAHTAFRWIAEGGDYLSGHGTVKGMEEGRNTIAREVEKATRLGTKRKPGGKLSENIEMQKVQGGERGGREIRHPLGWWFGGV